MFSFIICAFLLHNIFCFLKKIFPVISTKLNTVKANCELKYGYSAASRMLERVTDRHITPLTHLVPGGVNDPWRGVDWIHSGSRIPLKIRVLYTNPHTFIFYVYYTLINKNKNIY